MDFHSSNGNLSDECKNVMTDYYLHNDFLKYKTIALVLKCNPETAVAREKDENKYVPRRNIVNENVISSFNSSLEKCFHEHSSCFDSSIKIDTNFMKIQETIDNTLHYILSFIIEDLKKVDENEC